DCYLGPGAARRDPLAVPLLADLADLPPLYVAAAALDPLLDDSLRLVERLRAEGRPHRFALWPGLVHGAFQMSRELAPMRRHIAEIGAFLAESLARRKRQRNRSAAGCNPRLFMMPAARHQSIVWKR